MDPFEAWLNAQMQTNSIRSAIRLAKEAGLDPGRVTDWLVGRGSPDDAEIERLAAYFGANPEQVRQHVAPRRTRKK